MKIYFGKYRGSDLLSVLWKDSGYFWWLSKEADQKHVRNYCLDIIDKINFAALQNARCGICGGHANNFVYYIDQYHYDGKDKLTYGVIPNGLRCDDIGCFVENGRKYFLARLSFESIDRLPHKCNKLELMKLLLYTAGFDTRKRFSVKRLQKFLDGIIPVEVESETQALCDKQGQYLLAL